MTLQECYNFASTRETMPTSDLSFWVYSDSYTKASAMLRGLLGYIEHDLYNLLYGNLFLHYVIITPFSLTKEITHPDGSTQTITITNDLYDKYKIASKAFIVSSASDGSSSSSLFTTDSMNKGGFLMQDLIKTPYGEYVYAMLEQLGIDAVLL